MIFALSLCLHGAADQGQTCTEIAAAEAAKLEEGKEKQDYLKIVEALEDPLESAWSAVQRVGTFAPSRRGLWTGSDLIWGRFVVETWGLPAEVGGQSSAVGHCRSHSSECWLCDLMELWTHRPW